MSDEDRWRPIRGESGAEPDDDPTGPIPAVTDDGQPGFPPVSEDPAAWSAETAGGFPASKERAPFEPPNSPGESFTALRRSLAERVARYTEPEGGWPELPLDSTPPFGLNTASEDGQNESPEVPRTRGPGSLPKRRRPGLSETPAMPEASSAPEAPAEPRVGMSDTSAAPPASSMFEPPDGPRAPDVFEPPDGAEAPGKRRTLGRRKPFRLPEDDIPAPEASSTTEAPATMPEIPAVPEAFGRPEATEAPAMPKPPIVMEAAEQAEEEEFFDADEHPPLWDKVVAPTAPTGPPPRPGIPSSGNMRLPDWMKDGDASPPPVKEPRRSRLPLLAGISVLVLGLIVAGSVALVKNGGMSGPGNDRALAPTAPATPSPTQRVPPEKTLPHFRGPHRRPAGRIVDHLAGLSYLRLTSPWAIPAKKSPMIETGFSVSQFAVTEAVKEQPVRWARLMSAVLPAAERNSYHGPGTERGAALAVADLYEGRLYAFRHHKRLLASQPLNVDGHQGWLLGTYLTYHRAGVRSTGDVFTVVVVDTGRGGEPGVLLMTAPNTDRKLWPDINFVIGSLKVL